MLVGPLALMLPLLLSGTDAAVDAYQRGDLDEVARMGGQVGAAGIEAMLAAHPDAALTAAAGATDRAELLAPLASLAGSWDRTRAAPAAATAAAIAAGLAQLPVEAEDLAETGRAWRALAMRADRWADVRVHALEVAAAIAHATSADDLGYDLALLTDGDPEVRRAAAELVPQPAPPAARAPLAAVVARDRDPIVALAAAQALCGDLGFGDPPAPILAALGDAGLARLRALAVDPPTDAPGPALVDAARCLAADRDPASATAVRALVNHGPRALRGAINRLRR
ncbi:MAG: hypothetical protein K8W52_32455 [Deltaproteobacteria bacterium]|nr:hypothetical protein [Deltaproteobacteria bacterium]